MWIAMLRCCQNPCGSMDDLLLASASHKRNDAADEGKEDGTGIHGSCSDVHLVV